MHSMAPKCVTSGHICFAANHSSNLLHTRCRVPCCTNSTRLSRPDHLSYESPRRWKAIGHTCPPSGIRHHHGRRQRIHMCSKRSPDDEKTEEEKIESQLSKDRVIILAVAILLTILVELYTSLNKDDVADAIFGDGVTTGIGSMATVSGLGLGDFAGAALWSAALYFASPAQLLLLFLGKIETERPSDWLLRQLGELTNQRVDDPAYSAPLWIRVPTLLVFAASGLGVAWAFQAGLGDATWSVSTGIGACMAAAVYEVGRPERLSADQAVQLESRWQEFARFADARLRRSGRCHESEVKAALSSEVRGFRGSGALSNAEFRDMIRNWHPSADRTATGYYKNLSLRARIDPFTGEMTGSEEMSSAAGKREGI